MHMGYLVNIVAEKTFFYLIWSSCFRALSLCGRGSRSYKTTARDDWHGRTQIIYLYQQHYRTSVIQYRLAR